MDVRVINDIDGLTAAGAMWRACLEKSGNDNPFLELEWVMPWWECYGEGRTLLVLEVSEKGQVIGYGPFMMTPGLVFTEVNFIGCPLANCMGLIALPGKMHKTAEALLDCLLRLKHDVVFSLHGLDRSSESYSCLVGILQEKEIPFSASSVISPFIRIGQQFQDYMKVKAKHNSIRNIRAKEKKLSQLGLLAYVELEAKDMEKAFALHVKRWATRWDASGFTSEKGRRFFTKVMSGGNHVRVVVPAMTVDGEPVAFGYALLCNGRYLLYRIAHDNDFAIFSPGKILTKYMIEQCFRKGLSLFDFSVGYERFKLEWSSDHTYVDRITFCGPAPLSRAVFRARSLREKAVSRLKASQALVRFRRNVLGKLRYEASWMHLSQLLEGAGKAIHEVFAEGMSGSGRWLFSEAKRRLYSRGRYTLLEMEFKDGKEKEIAQVFGADLSGGSIPLTVRPFRAKDLDPMAQTVKARPAQILKRIHDGSKCFTADSDQSSPGLFCFVDFETIEIPQAGYKVGLDKNSAFICPVFAGFRDLPEAKFVSFFAGVTGRLRSIGLERCFLALEDDNPVTAVCRLGFRPWRTVKWVKVLGMGKVQSGSI